MTLTLCRSFAAIGNEVAEFDTDYDRLAASTDLVAPVILERAPERPRKTFEDRDGVAAVIIGSGRGGGGGTQEGSAQGKIAMSSFPVEQTVQVVLLDMNMNP